MIAALKLVLIPLDIPPFGTLPRTIACEAHQCALCLPLLERRSTPRVSQVPPEIRYSLSTLFLSTKSLTTLQALFTAMDPIPFLSTPQVLSIASMASGATSAKPISTMHSQFLQSPTYSHPPPKRIIPGNAEF